MKRSLKDYFIITLKGMGMGAADVVPGVSGGTIALISGIYEELIFSIRSINLEAIKLLSKGKFSAFSKAINLPFLLSLLLGIGISVISLAKVMTYLLNHYEILTWAFFFGLIIASSWLVGKKITNWSFSSILSLFAGIVTAYLITEMTPAATPDELWFVFLCGMIAICAMILPGISGAFLLLIMGKYAYILGAIDTFNLKIIIIFLCGASIGIISFSNILAYFLKRFHNATMALLTGFMIGSLNKVWPWKETVTTFIDRHGIEKPLIERNILPDTYTELYAESNYLFAALLCGLIGFVMILLLDYFANKKHH